MKKLLVLVAAMLAVGFASYYARYEGAVAAIATPTGTDAELAWLRTEFHLTAAAYAKIAALHEAYRPVCADHCSRYMAIRRRLAESLRTATGMSPQARELISEEAQVQAECHAAMLQYAYTVAGCMAPEQGQRYLEMIKREIVDGDPAGMFAAAR